MPVCTLQSEKPGLTHLQASFLPYNVVIAVRDPL